MIEQVNKNNSLLVSYGDWFINIYNIYLGNLRVSKYEEMTRKIKWIENDKYKVYIHVKLIKGYSEEKALNMIFSKRYMKDEDYLDIEKAV